MADKTYNAPEGAGQEAANAGFDFQQRLTNNPNKVLSKIEQNKGTNDSMLASLTTELAKYDPDNEDHKAAIEDIQSRIDFRQGKNEELLRKQALANQHLNQANKQAESSLVSDALTSPQDLIQKANVGDINTKENQAVDKNAGNAGKVTDAKAAQLNKVSTVDPLESFDPATMTPDTITPEVKKMLKELNPTEGDVSKLIKSVQTDPNKLAQLKLKVEQAKAVKSKAATMDPNSLEALKLKAGETSSETADAASMTPQQLAALELEAAQTNNTKVGDAATREVTAGELVGGSAVDQVRANAASQVDAVTGEATGGALMKNQMADLMTEFEGGQTPAWAAGAMRSAQEMLAKRGLGASSVAGQAVVQAAMEAAMPIAQVDSQTQALFQRENLTRKQEAALASAKYRADFLGQEFNQEFQAKVKNATTIGEIAKTNLTHQQQIVLEESRVANSVNLANLSARNAKVLADSAALSQVDLTNLTNAQQANITNANLGTSANLANLDASTKKLLSDASGLTSAQLANLGNEQASTLQNAALGTEVNMANAAAENTKTLSDAKAMTDTERDNARMLLETRIQNSKNFLEMDLANLSNEQQTELFKFKGRLDSMFGDQAANNASEQFNAASENQVNQFFADLTTSISKFNSEATNTIGLENMSEKNKIATVNAQLGALREEFNANQASIIAQANASWRQDIAKTEFAAEAEAMMDFTKDLNGLTNSKLDQIWQRERDIMAFAFTGSESAADRNLSLLLGDKQLDAAESEGKGALAALILEPIIDFGFSKLFG